MNIKRLLNILHGCVIPLIEEAKALGLSTTLADKISQAASKQCNVLLAGQNTERAPALERNAFAFIYSLLTFPPISEQVWNLQTEIAIAMANSFAFQDEEETHHPVSENEELVEELARYFREILAPKYYPQLSPGQLGAQAQQWHAQLAGPGKIEETARQKFGYVPPEAPAKEVVTSAPKSSPS